MVKGIEKQRRQNRMEKLDGKRNAKLGKGYKGTRIQT